MSDSAEVAPAVSTKSGAEIKFRSGRLNFKGDEKERKKAKKVRKEKKKERRALKRKIGGPEEEDETLHGGWYLVG